MPVFPTRYYPSTLLLTILLTRQSFPVAKLACTFQRSLNPQRCCVVLGKQLLLTSTFFSLISRWTSPWLCRKRIPSTTSRAICKRVSRVSPALGRQKSMLVTNKTTSQSTLLTPTESSVWSTERLTALGYTRQKSGWKKMEEESSQEREVEEKQKMVSYKGQIKSLEGCTQASWRIPACDQERCNPMTKGRSSC